MFVKAGDKVRVIADEEKDKEGTVIGVGRKNDRIVVKGLNMIRRHEKPPQTNQNGGVVKKEGPIHVPNAMPIDPESGKPAGIDHEIVDGNKVRIAKVSDKVISKR